MGSVFSVYSKEPNAKVAKYHKPLFYFYHTVYKLKDKEFDTSIHILVSLDIWVIFMKECIFAQILAIMDQLTITVAQSYLQ